MKSSRKQNVVVAKALLTLARELVAEKSDKTASNEWITAQEMECICPTCAKKMKTKKITKVKASIVERELLKTAMQRRTAAWENVPKAKLQAYWKSMTGDAVHKITKCIKKISGHVDNPGAFCASLARAVGYKPEQ